MADIAINPVTRRVQFTGNIGTGPFAFTFNVLQASDIVVYKNNNLLALTTDYTVTINANGTGSITLVSALVATDVLIIVGGRELSRTTDFVTSGDLLAASLNEQLDSNVIMSQQLDERISRAIRSQPGDELQDLYIPLKEDRAGSFLRFDSNGNVETSSTSEFTPTAIFATRGEGDGSTTAFTLPVTLSTNPSSVQVHIDGVHQNQNSYSTSGSVLTFTEAPPNKSSIEFTIFSVGSLSSTTAAQVSISDAGGYYSGNAVEAALQEVGDTGILNSTGSTGTGAVVLGTSPTIATPTITGQFAGFSGNTLSAGAGFASGTGTLHKSSVSKDGTIFVTRIFVDLTGANCGGTAGDIIGDDGTANPCHIGQITTARNGTIFHGTLRCVETPGGGDTDIDLYAATEGTGVEDGAISSLTETQLVNGGTHSAGDEDLLAAYPAANQYLYLVGQGGGNATYTAGQFLIELYGYA